VHSFTINHQSWDGGTEPYAIALVDDPRAGGPAPHHQHRRLPPDDSHRHAVQVTFEQHDLVWFPLFEPASARHDRVRAAAIISGIGQSDVGRRLGRTGLDLTIDAALEAIADAGLTTDDIDGIATYPGAGGGAGPGSRAGLARGAGRAAPEGELAHRAASRAPPSWPPSSTR
jgi:hypothetical protein